MASDFEFQIRYWGVTGTFATPLTPQAVEDKVVGAVQALLENGEQDVLSRGLSEAELRELLGRHVPYWQRTTYGGNTTCIEVQTAESFFILDMGSGARELGRDLARRWNAADYRGNRTAHVLITHPHLDHTFATPFLDPLYDERNRFHIRAPASVLDSLEAILGDDAPMRQVYFPTTYKMMRGIASLLPVAPGDSWELEGTRISTLPLNHPGGCLGYKLERGGRCIVFASDHEHRGSPDPSLCEFAARADLLYTDAQYLAAEYVGEQGINGEPGISRVGWGHSTVESVIETAVAAGVRRLHLGHHEPMRTDKRLAEIESYAQSYVSQCQDRAGRAGLECRVDIAREGQTVCI